MRINLITLMCLASLAVCLSSANGEGAQKVTCKGKVVDANGQAIAGAKVGAYSLSVSMVTYTYEVELMAEKTTGDDGLFTFERAEDASHLTGQSIILVEKEGFALGWSNWFKREDIDIEITLGQAKILGGQVVDESGNPVADAEVSISILMAPSTGHEQYVYLVGKVSEKFFSTRTDAEGKYVFNRITDKATAEFTAKKPGRATISTFNPSGRTGPKLQYTAGRDDIKIEMPVEAKVEGVVVEKGTGRPVAGIKLFAVKGLRQPTFGSEPVTTKEDGTFRIDSLVGGSQFLKLAPAKDELAEWMTNPVEVTVESGKTKTGVKVQVSKGGVLEVAVTDAADNRPVKNANVTISDAQRTQWSNGLSDSNGLARIRLAPGEYRTAQVYKEGYSRQGQGQGDTITIEENKTVRLDIQLKAAPKITGVVRDAAGKAVDGAKVQLVPMGGQNVTSDSLGKFEISWHPQQWNREDRELDYYLVARHEKRNLAAAVEFSEGAKTADVNLVAGVTFTGKVADEQGKGIPGARIMVMFRGPGSRYSSQIVHLRQGFPTADAEGNFEVRAIPPDHSYNITASADDYGKRQIDVSAEDAADNKLDVGTLTLILANLSVSGVVVDEAGKAVADAYINAYGQGQPDIHNIRTDSEGKFTIAKVCAGQLRISANTQGGSRLHGSVQTEGGAKDVKIVLSPSGSSASQYVPREPASLVGTKLPELKKFNINLSVADANDKPILVCFWDMNQRPSRHRIRQLAKQAEQLKEKGVTVVCIQALKVERKALDDWVKKYEVPFPVSMVEGDEEKTRFAWGVKSLPWLILTDKEHVVQAQGFGLGELDEKMKQISGE